MTKTIPRISYETTVDKSSTNLGASQMRSCGMTPHMGSYKNIITLDDHLAILG